MIHFILRSMDGDNDAAVLAVPIDFSKAFNRMLHSDILCNLDSLNVPKCATKLIRSYLTKQSKCVKYSGQLSSFQSCPGGGPQGGLLTGILFIIQVNKAGSPCVPRRLVQDEVTAQRMETGNRATIRLAVGYNSASRLEDKEEPNSMPDEAVECAPRSEVTMESLMEVEGEKQSTKGMEAEDLSSLDKTRTRLDATKWESLSAQLEEKEILITTRPQMDPSIGQKTPYHHFATKNQSYIRNLL